jgi:intracellular septation protein
MNPKLKLVLDLGPLLVFFVAYRFAGLLAATAALMVFTLASLALTYALERKIAIMPLVSGVAVAVFGGATLLLEDELFIKMKPTLVNLLFSAILLGGLAYGKPLMKYLLGEAMSLTERGWRLLSRNWGLFFLFLAALNEVIWRHFPTDFWVNFKVFGMFTLTLLFTACQFPMIKREWVEESD